MARKAQNRTDLDELLGGEPAGEQAKSQIDDGAVTAAMVGVPSEVVSGTVAQSPPATRPSMEEMLEVVRNTGIKTDPVVLKNGWLPIASVSRNGMPYLLTDGMDKSGVEAYWRKSRAFANATHRWETTGFWTNAITGQRIDFTPLYWKARF